MRPDGARGRGVRGLIGRIWIGLVLTAVTLAGAVAIPRLAGLSGLPWPKLAAVALLGESVLLVMTARRAAPPAIDEEPHLLPDSPLPADPRWLWMALPTAVVGLALFVAALLFF